MNYVLLLADGEPTSLGVIMAVVAVVMAVVKIFERMIEYLIAEAKRRKEEAAGTATPSGEGRVECPTSPGCQECQRQVQAILTMLKEDLRDAMQARIDDLKAQRDDYKSTAARTTTAVERLARAVRDGFNVVDEEPEPEDENDPTD